MEVNQQNSVPDSLSKHIPYIRRMVSKVTRDQNVIDDITQECCVRIIEKEKLWDPKKGSITSWMNVVTRNVIRNFLKKQKAESSRKETLFDNDLEFTEQDENNIEERIKFVLNEFKQLTDKKKNILYQRYVENKTMDQIAQDLNITRSAVIDHIQQSLKKIRTKANFNKFFSLFLPWRWNFKTASAIMLKNAYTEVISVVAVLSLISGGGYFAINHYYAGDATPRILTASSSTSPISGTNNSNTDTLAATSHIESPNSDLKEEEIHRLLQQLVDPNKRTEAQAKLKAHKTAILPVAEAIFSQSPPNLQEEIITILKWIYADKENKLATEASLKRIAQKNPAYAETINTFLNPSSLFE